MSANTIKIATGFTASAEAAFKVWAESVGRSDINADACLQEATNQLGSLSDPAKWGHQYELGRLYTKSGNPELFGFDVEDIIFEDVEAV